MKKEEPKFKLVDGHQMKLSFELDGVKYWEFSDSKAAPCHRMFAALDFYNEFNMRCTRDYLIAHQVAMKEALDGKKGTIDLIRVSQLHLQLQERLEWVFEPDTAYKYASVIFIDENEDPYTYDFKYGQEKIARWKKQTPATFFLSMPVKRLFPLLDLSEKDLEEYSKVQSMVKKEHLENIFTMLSSEHKTKDWYKALELLKQEDLALEK